MNKPKKHANAKKLLLTYKEFQGDKIARHYTFESLPNVRGIGAVVYAFEALALSVRRLIGDQLDVNVPHMLQVTQPLSFTALMNVLKMVGPKDDRLKELLKNLDTCNTLRNNALHSIYIPGENGNVQQINLKFGRKEEAIRDYDESELLEQANFMLYNAQIAYDMLRPKGPGMVAQK